MERPTSLPRRIIDRGIGALAAFMVDPRTPEEAQAAREAQYAEITAEVTRTVLQQRQERGQAPLANLDKSFSRIHATGAIIPTETGDLHAR